MHICTSQLDWHAAEGTSHIPGAEAACPGHFLIMFSRLGLIRDVRVIMVQGGRPCAGALGLWLFTVFWLGEWIHQYSDGHLLGGYRVTGEIWNGEGRLELESNALGLCVIGELIPFWWAQQMTVWVLIAFQIWWARLTSKLCSHFLFNIWIAQIWTEVMLMCKRCEEKSLYALLW